MKTGVKLTIKSVEAAQADLERAVSAFVKRAEWLNPYSIAGRQYRSTVRELRKPLVELHLARRAQARIKP